MWCVLLGALWVYVGGVEGEGGGYGCITSLRRGDERAPKERQVRSHLHTLSALQTPCANSYGRPMSSSWSDDCFDKPGTTCFRYAIVFPRRRRNLRMYSYHQCCQNVIGFCGRPNTKTGGSEDSSQGKPWVIGIFEMPKDEGLYHLIAGSTDST